MYEVATVVCQIGASACVLGSIAGCAWLAWLERRDRKSQTAVVDEALLGAGLHRLPYETDGDALDRMQWHAERRASVAPQAERSGVRPAIQRQVVRLPLFCEIDDEDETLDQEVAS